MEGRAKNAGVLSVLVLALIGLADSIFLSYKHITTDPLYCSSFGCDVVTTSAYSLILGVPVAYLGIIYYGTLVALMAAYMIGSDMRALWALRVAASVGVVFSGWFVYVQLFILGEMCPYCIVSAVTTLILAIVLWSNWAVFKRDNIS